MGIFNKLRDWRFQKAQEKAALLKARLSWLQDLQASLTTRDPYWNQRGELQREIDKTAGALLSHEERA